MLAQERLIRIAELIGQKETGVVTVSELCDRLGVSAMTVRRDLSRLEEMAIVKRVHGGALAYQGVNDWKPFDERHEERSREKQLIGWTAAHFVRDGETILLDAGTTTPYVARHLMDKKVTVITHALPVAAELSPYVNISTFLLGGILRHNELYTAGASVLREIAHLTVDKSFLSCAGFGIERGIMDPDPQEAELKRAMAAAGREVILVADSSKWGRVQRAEVLPLAGVQKLITDDRIAVADVRAIEALGVEVITPGQLTTRSYLTHALGADGSYLPQRS
jgi:DeoR/GlpR family transcriptional regulator of sugar metabolism